MSPRVALPVVLIALGLPAFIFYTIFFGGSPPEMKPIANFERYRTEISGLSGDRYQVIEVLDEGGSLRVNVWSQAASPSRSELRVQTLNTLYDVQSIVGQEISTSVWLYATPVADRSDLQGLAFFRALTGKTVFKYADELQ